LSARSVSLPQLGTDCRSPATPWDSRGVSGRHEMLDEINRDEVLINLLDWITRTLKAREGHREAPSVA